MPQIINPFRAPDSPLASVITRVGDQLFGDTLTPAIKREQLQKVAQERLAAERENVETGNLMRAFGGQDADLITASQAAIGADYDPRNLAQLQLFRAANQYGAADQRAQNAQVGAGQSFDNTANAFGAKLAETMRNNDMQSADRRYGMDRDFDLGVYNNNKQSADRRYGMDRDFDLGVYKHDNSLETAMVDGQGQFVRRADAAGMRAPLSSGEMTPAMKFNQVYDLLESQGVPPERARQIALQQSMYRSEGQKISVGADGGVTVESGGLGSLGDLTNSTRSQVQQADIKAEDFLRLAARARPYLTNPADAKQFGAVGSARAIAQATTQALGAVAEAFGASDAVDLRRKLVAEADGRQVRSEETGKVVGTVADFLPELYDPALDSTQSLWVILQYMYASAGAGQDGRDLSDADFKNARKSLGDPRGLLESQASLLTKLDEAVATVEGQVAVRRNAREGRPLSAGRTTAPQQRAFGGTVSPPETAGTSPETAIPIESESAAEALVGKFVRLNGRVFLVEAD